MPARTTRLPTRDQMLHLALIAVAGLVAACFLFVLTRQPPDWTLLTLSREVWIAIVTSFAASALFAFIAAISAAMALSSPTREDSFFLELHDELGIISGRSHRVDYLQQYQDLIRRARRRIWALGITNKAFLNTHRTELLQKATEKIDVVIMFLDPDAKLTAGALAQVPLLSVQEKLEGGQSTGSIADVRARLGPLMAASHVRAMLISTPTQFSCLVIDDDVFFFPFTAPAVSSHQPMLHVRADRVVGSAIVGHLKVLIDTPDICRPIEAERPTAKAQP